jgi:hypothetical protein
VRVGVTSLAQKPFWLAAAAQETPPPTSPPSTGGQVAGQVLDDTGDVPTLACVESRPIDFDAAGYGSARVDERGRYVLALPAGSHVLEVHGCGYSEAYAAVYQGGGDRLADAPQVAVMEAGTTEVDLIIPRAARISGRVTYDDGQPAVAALPATTGARE